MERWAGKTAIVTGAASGIGEAIATELIRHRVNVIAVDIAYERLQSTATKWGQLANRGEYHLKKCDISKKEDIDDLFTFVESLGGVNIMVNNAGITDFSRVIDTNWETMEKLVKVFMLGTTAFMIRASHSMRKQNTEGHIINVNSVLGLMIPNYVLRKDNDAVSYNIYPACKHGTVALTETVRRELAKIEAKIRVTSICPGLVHTNIGAFDTVMGGLLTEFPALEPQDIASTVIYALSMRSEVEDHIDGNMDREQLKKRMKQPRPCSTNIFARMSIDGDEILSCCKKFREEHAQKSLNVLLCEDGTMNFVNASS